MAAIWAALVWILIAFLPLWIWEELTLPPRMQGGYFEMTLREIMILAIGLVSFVVIWLILGIVIGNRYKPAKDEPADKPEVFQTRAYIGNDWWPSVYVGLSMLLACICLTVLVFGRFRPMAIEGCVVVGFAIVVNQLYSRMAHRKEAIAFEQIYGGDTRDKERRSK